MKKQNKFWLELNILANEKDKIIHRRGKSFTTYYDVEIIDRTLRKVFGDY